MTGSTGELQNAKIGRFTGGVLAAALIAAGMLSGPPASAITAEQPTISFDGNTLAITTPKDERVNRLNQALLGVTNGPLSRVVNTTREGYTFGGWSFAKGSEAVTQLATATTSDSFRLIYAVWNTNIRYRFNGADSGALTNFKTRDVYRFGQNLSLPTAGTLTKSNFDFGGWMAAPYSPTRITNYLAGSSDVGNLTFYAAWIRTVSFDGNGSTTGVAPTSVVYTSGGPGLKLPSFNDITLRKPGHNFAGWSTSPTGSIIRNPGSFVPLLAKSTVYAIWKVQGTADTEEIAFKPGRSVLRAGQKRLLNALATSIGRATAVQLSVESVRAPGSARSLGKARNVAVVKYLRSVGIVATVTRANSAGTSGSSRSPANNRVTVKATWTNPAN